jgi:hypothetical protein
VIWRVIKLQTHKIATRYDVDINVMASIFGGDDMMIYTSINASLSGIALRAIESEVPFQVGTLIELKIPFSVEGESNTNYLALTGKVVRIETDLSNPEAGKSLCGIHLVDMDKDVSKMWSTIIESLKDRILAEREHDELDYADMLQAS